MIGLFQFKAGRTLATIIWAAGTVARALPPARSMRHAGATTVELVPCGIVTILGGRIVANVAFSVVAVSEDFQAHDCAAPCDLLVQLVARMTLAATVRATSPIARPTCCVVADLSDSGSTIKAGFSRVVGVKTVGNVLDDDSSHSAWSFLWCLNSGQQVTCDNTTYGNNPHAGRGLEMFHVGHGDMGYAPRKTSFSRDSVISDPGSPTNETTYPSTQIPGFGNQ